MSGAFIISIDQGTTGSRVFCFNTEGQILSRAYKEFTQHFPAPGWVEHDAEQIWSGVEDLLASALEQASLKAENALGIGITNQRETIVVWDRKTGQPVHRAIVWQCRRTADLCRQLQKEGHEDLVRSKTGLRLDPYFSGSKLMWILDNVQGVRRRAENGELCCGTIDSFLLFKLTGNHATDYTNASRTMLYDIQKRCWDEDLLRIFGNIPMALLPEVKSSRSEFGRTVGQRNLPDGIPVLAMAGDQQAATFGQLCVRPGEAKNTYGTGCFLVFNTGSEFVSSHSGLLTTLACNEKGEVCYALEGSVFIGGAVVQWLRDFMSFFAHASDSEDIIAEIEDEEDELVFVPAFVGLGAPHWDPNARGAIFGLTRDASPARIVRAALKSIALQSMDLVRAMENDTGTAMSFLRADGGAIANNFLARYQADVLNCRLERPTVVDQTAVGVAYLAGMEAGVWSDVSELEAIQAQRDIFEPQMSAAKREREIKFWHKGVARVADWSERES